MKIAYQIRIMDRIHAAIDAAQKENRTIKKIELEAWEWIEFKSQLPLSDASFLMKDSCSVLVNGVLVCPIGCWYEENSRKIDLFERVKGGWEHVPFKTRPSVG
jgi:hypothetical protein